MRFYTGNLDTAEQVFEIKITPRLKKQGQKSLNKINREIEDKFILTDKTNKAGNNSIRGRIRRAAEQTMEGIRNLTSALSSSQASAKNKTKVQITTDLQKVKSIQSTEKTVETEATQSSKQNSNINNSKSISTFFNIDYANTNLFAMKLEIQLREMMKIKSVQDINAMISQISKNTGADEQTVSEVLAGLTQFSSYSQLGVIEKKFKELGIGYIYIPQNSRLNINNALMYIEEKKKQIDLGYQNFNEALFLDDNVLSHLKDLKENNPALYKEIKDGIIKGDIKVVHLSGWNNIIDGQDVSHGFLGFQTDLITSATAIINKMKKEGLSIEEALNGNFLKKVREILGDDVEITIIENKKEINANNIADNLNPLYPSHKTIKAVIDTIIEETMPDTQYSIQEIMKGRELLAKYFEAMISCHSPETMTDMLKNKYEQIIKIARQQGKTEDDIIYVIPEKGKSFDLITYQYLHTNKINPDKVICFAGDDKPPVDLNDKIIVILDDIVGSGCSIVHQEFHYRDFIRNSGVKNPTVIFSPISSLRSGFENVFNEMTYVNRTQKDYFKPEVMVDYKKFADTLTDEERNLLSKLIGDSGYGDGYACSSMPYMLPDNNTYASGLLLEYCINNPKGSKCVDWFCRFASLVEKKLRLDT